LVNKKFCQLTVPILWRQPWDFIYAEICKKSYRTKIVATYLSCLDAEDKSILYNNNDNSILLSHLLNTTTFDYVCYLRSYSKKNIDQIIDNWIKNITKDLTLQEQAICLMKSSISLALEKMILEKCKKIRKIHIVETGTISFLNPQLDTICAWENLEFCLLELNVVTKFIDFKKILKQIFHHSAKLKSLDILIASYHSSIGDLLNGLVQMQDKIQKISLETFTYNPRLLITAYSNLVNQQKNLRSFKFIANAYSFYQDLSTHRYSGLVEIDNFNFAADSLMKIVLNIVKVTPKLLAKLSQLPNLEVLQMKYCAIQEELDYTACQGKFYKLHDLELFYNGRLEKILFTSYDFGFLQTVRLVPRYKMLNYVQEMDEIVNLIIKKCPHITQLYSIINTPEQLNRLSIFANLKELGIIIPSYHRSEHNPEDILLKHATPINVQELNLSETNIDHKVLLEKLGPWLYKFPKLKRLTLPLGFPKYLSDLKKVFASNSNSNSQLTHLICNRSIKNTSDCCCLEQVYTYKEFEKEEELDTI
ncbi:1845_t:CDS:1, partial [Cetraspora pellucida]